MSARHRVRSREFLFALGLALMAGLICAGLYRLEIDQLEQRWLERESSRNAILSKLLGENFKRMADDLRVLSTSDGLLAFIASGQPADLDRAAKRAATFSRQQRGYDQIRYLDERGQEIFRINQGGMRVPPAQLQNKADRGYFKKTQALAAGQLFISAFDLNIEAGAIEQPLKPMLRLATPVFDEAGRRRGIYVINFLGAQLISYLQNFAPAYQQRFRLLNAQGHWLKGAQPGDEWGFMLPDHAGRALAQTDPVLWAQMLREPTGRAAYHGGTLTWDRFFPRNQVISEGPGGTVAEEDFLIVASEMSATEWTTAYHDVRRVFVIVALVLLVLIVAGGGYFRARQQAVARLKKSQQMFERLFEQSPDAVILVDRNSHVVRANAQAAALFGWSREELGGKPVATLLVERSSAGKPAMLAGYFSAPHPREPGAGLEVLARSKARGDFPVDLMLSPLETDAGPQALVTLRDSTARVRLNEELEKRVQERTTQLESVNRELNREIAERSAAEEALRQSEHRFRELLEHSADGISLIDAKNNILYVSPSVAAVEGYTADELTGRNGLENTHPDDLPLVGETVQKLMANPGQPVPVLWRRRHKHGHWIWLEGIATNLLHDPDVRGIVTNYRDVTARKQAEAAVRESEQRFRTLTENLPDIVSRFDRNFRLLYANPARETLTGQPLVNCIGKNLIELGSVPANAERFQAAIARVFASRQTERLEVTYPTPAGTTAWESTLVAEPSADGSIASVLVLSHDITDRHRAEEQIRQMNASLEERVRARTAQIEAVNRELEAFSYSVSHDLRAPLRHIDGFTGLLAKRTAGKLDEQSQRHLATISEAARQMGRLIDDLLAFSRMGRAPLTAVEIDHDALVAAVIRDGRYDQNPNPVTWAISPLPRVFADPAMLRQVWVNLIDNAVKYSGKNPSPRIEIGYQPAAGERAASFFIRDNGVGFDMKYATKLFGVFQRLHGVDEFPGTGVGLANVLRIVTRHGGRVWAESRPGEGATFHFSLPASPS